MEPGLPDNPRMAKRPKKPPAPPKMPAERIPLYVGEWIARLGRKPVDVARAVGIGESYLSSIKSQGRTNPSYSILFRIADELGITVDDLRRNPPPRSTVEAVSRLSAKAQERLFDPQGDR